MDAPHHISAGDGPAVIFLHGIGGGADCFDLQVDVFARNGYRAIAWDMPGYGNSRRLSPVTFPGLADALVDLLDALELEKVHVVGHSIGGMLLQAFAKTHQNRLHSMVLGQTSPAFGNTDGAFQKTFVAARLAPLEDGKTMADVAASVVPGMLGDAPSQAGTALAMACMSRVPPEVYGDIMRCLVTFDGRAGLASITVPTLVLAGEKDTTASPSMMRRMAAKIAGADYVCIPGAGHLAPMAQPAGFNRAVLDFITRHR